MRPAKLAFSGYTQKVDGAAFAVLQLFGLPNLSVGGEVLRFPNRKGLALLLYLALEGAQPREHLAGLLWTDSQNPKDALRNVLAQVNKVLQAAGLEPLIATRQDIKWQQTLYLDALQLQEQPSETLLLHLNGAWLEGFSLEGAPEFDAWAQERGAYYTGLLQKNLELVAEQSSNTGRLEQALNLARKRLRLDVLCESAYQQLMRLQRLAGREAEARETLLLCRTTLQRELGMTPSSKTLGIFFEPLAQLEPSERLFGREAA